MAKPINRKLTYKNLNDLLDFIQNNELFDEIKIVVESTCHQDDAEDYINILKDLLEDSFCDGKNHLKLLLEFFVTDKNFNSLKIANKGLYRKLIMLKKVYKLNQENKSILHPFIISKSSMGFNSESREFILSLKRGDSTSFSLILTPDHILNFISTLSVSLNKHFDKFNNDDLSSDMIESYMKISEELIDNLSSLFKNSPVEESIDEAAIDNERE